VCTLEERRVSVDKYGGTAGTLVIEPLLMSTTSDGLVSGRRTSTNSDRGLTAAKSPRGANPLEAKPPSSFLD
jgi:hypothetical protein